MSFYEKGPPLSFSIHSLEFWEGVQEKSNNIPFSFVVSLSLTVSSPIPFLPFLAHALFLQVFALHPQTYDAIPSLVPIKNNPTLLDFAMCLDTISLLRSLARNVGVLCLDQSFCLQIFHAAY